MIERILTGLFLLVGLHLFLFPTMIYRLIAPVPAGDLEAIKLYLKLRDERFIQIKKVWFGGPVQGNTRRAKQSGHPYVVTAADADGRRYIHRLAAVGRNELGKVALMKNEKGFWDPVLQ